VGQQDLVSMWDEKTNDGMDSQKKNPFSAQFDPTANKRLSKSKYGRPVSGSLTAKRAQKVF